MGNRAVIALSTKRTGVPALYLHWNGSAESVLAFLHAARHRGFRDPAHDECYALARLCGLIHEFFGVNESTSLGIGLIDELDVDNHDNGVFVVGKNWEIIDRWGAGSTSVKSVDELTPREQEKYQAIYEQLTKAEEPVKEAA